MGSTPSSRYACLSCHLIARDPRQVTCCGKLFCKTCFDGLRRTSSSIKCPNCHKNVANKFFEDRRTDEEIGTLKIYCTNEDDGCGWQGEVKEIEQHLRTKCPYQVISCRLCEKQMVRRVFNSHIQSECPKRPFVCPYCGADGIHDYLTKEHLVDCPDLPLPCPNKECTATVKQSMMVAHLEDCEHQALFCSNGCGELVKRATYTSHQSQCIKRPYTCPYCSEEGVYDHLTHEHLDRCSCLPLPCKNDGCHELIKRSQMEGHLLVCSHKKVPCIYSAIGCKAFIKRHHINKHGEQCIKEHLHFAIEKVKELEEVQKQCFQVIDKQNQELKKDKQAISRLSEQLCFMEATKTKSITVVLKSFTALRDSNQEWYSPGFYVGSGSYKMRLIVCANGEGDGSGRYVSVFICIMPGLYDEQLEWPIEGEVIIELLNQLEDKSHHKKTIMLDELTPVWNRSKVTEEQQEGVGLKQYISHQELSTKNCHYLHNDSLYFRVTATPRSKTKPWLAYTIY